MGEKLRSAREALEFGFTSAVTYDSWKPSATVDELLGRAIKVVSEPAIV